MNVDCHNWIAIGPLQLGSRAKEFANIFYIMGYNLENVRNGKSFSKISKLPSLRTLTLKSNFSENLEDNYGKCCWRASKVLLSNNFSHKNLPNFLKNSNRHKISFFNARDLKLSDFDIFHMLFSYLPFFKVVRYSFFWTIPSIFNWRFTYLPLI